MLWGERSYFLFAIRCVRFELLIRFRSGFSSSFSLRVVLCCAVLFARPQTVASHCCLFARIDLRASRQKHFRRRGLKQTAR